MADVRPFHGVRFGPKAGAITRLLAPPYDVIGPQEQEALHQQSPYNVVRLELGKTSPHDTPQDNRYTRAREALHAWLQEGVLIKEDRPAIYLCRHRFWLGGREYARWELLAQVRLAEWKERVMLPHEHTLPEPKVDRLHLLRATETNVSPVYALYKDAAGRLAALLQAQTHTAPVVEVSKWRDAALSLWAIVDSLTIAQVHQYLAKAALYIADGHHRYETALAYRSEHIRAGRNSTDDAGFQSVFMSLTSLADPGLVVLPIHRLVRGVSGDRSKQLKERLEQEWVVEPRPARTASLERDLRQVEQEMAQEGAHSPCYGLYGLEHGTVLLLRPRSLEQLRGRLPEEVPESLRVLDLTLLHQVILHGYLAIGQEAHEIEAALGFTHSAYEAAREVDAGQSAGQGGGYRLAVLVNPTRVNQLVEVAEAGEKMPQKSTFFYPKLPTGLVMRPLEDASSLP